MIASHDLQTYLKAQPFRPFRVQMASGRIFDIRHPEMAVVGKNFLMLFTFTSEEPGIVDRWETVSLMLMERVFFPEAESGNGNGSPR